MNAALLIVIVLSIAMASVVVIAALTGFWRRRDPLPADMLDGDLPGEGGYRGEYLGSRTRTDDKPETAQGFLSPGPGLFFVDRKGVNFLVDHALSPIHIPFARVRDVAVRTRQSGTHRGKPALDVEWVFEPAVLRSVFVLDDTSRCEGLVREIRAAIAEAPDGSTGR
ncbi:MAG: hypothetical protein KJ042_10175 [Deltaproteobacteria bacterium]|nr:hypothetical protein [Deltaproteobacteria bacterium]